MIKYIIYQDLNIEGCTGCCDHKSSKTVDSRLDHQIGDIKYGTLDSGRKSDPQDLQETGSVNG